jgi:hypothetical protein
MRSLEDRLGSLLDFQGLQWLSIQMMAAPATSNFYSATDIKPSKTQ